MYQERDLYQERDRGAAIAIAAVSGALIGAGVALFLAPKAGHALRGDVAASMGALRDAIAARCETLASRAGVSLDSLHATVERAVEAVEGHAREAVNAVKRTDAGQTRG